MNRPLTYAPRAHGSRTMRYALTRARAGLVREYLPAQRTRARRYADRLDMEYGAICCGLSPIFAAAAVPFVDVSNVTEYGLTQKLSNAVRVF